MNKFLILFLLFIYSCSAQAQKFQRVFGSNYYDHATGALQTYDGDFILTGTTGEGATGTSDILIHKLTSYGYERKFTTVGTPYQDVANGFIITSDSGFAFSGHTNNPLTGYDVLLLKTDSLGGLKWYKTFGGNDWDFGHKLRNDLNGGYLIAAQTYSYGAGNGDGYVIRTNASGDTLWTRRFGGTGDDGARDILQARNGKIYVTGFIENTGTGKKDAALLQYDASGNLLWQQLYGGSMDEVSNCLFEMPDSSIVMIGTGSSNIAWKAQILMVIADKNGNQQLIRDYGSLEDDEGAMGCLFNGNIALTGSFNLGNNQQDVYLRVVDQNGNDILPYNPTFGDLYNEFAASISITADNSFLIAASTSSWTEGLENLYLIKTDGSGFNSAVPQVYVSVDEAALPDIKSNNPYPNPFSNETSISCDCEIMSASFYTLQGMEANDLFKIRSNSNGNYSIENNSAAKGVYILKAVTSNKRVLNLRLLVCP